MAYTYDLSTWEVEKGGPEVQGHSQLQRELGMLIFPLILNPSGMVQA